MRVLFVNQYYPPDASATSHLLGDLSEDLARHHEVWVVVGHPSYSPEGGTFDPKVVRVVRAWSTRFARTSMAGRLANYLTFLISSFGRAVRVPRPDIVVAMTDPPVIGLVGLVVARRHRVPFVYVCQDIFPDVAIALGRAANPLAVRLWRDLNGLLRRGAASVVAIGRDMAEKLEAEGVPREKIALAQNWANDASPDPEIVSLARREAGWDGRFVVMHGGNQGLAQNLGALIEAADLLRDSPEILIVLMGDGAAKHELQARADRLGLGNVAFLPQRSKGEAQALLAAADLHVISLAPGLRGCVVPSKLYGILAHGRPFVAAVEEGSEVDRVIQETGAGVRTDPGDAKALAAVIAEFASGERNGIEAGARGRKEFEVAYERSAATDRYLRLIESLVGGREERQKV